MSELIDWLSSV